MTKTKSGPRCRHTWGLIQLVGSVFLGAITVTGCAEPAGRGPSFPLLGDDSLIRDIDADEDLRTAIIELPEVGEAEVLYAVRDGKAIWTGDILLGDADELEQGFRGATLTSGLWPNKTLKYRFGGSLTAGAKTALRSAMAQWESSTSVRFVESPAKDTGGFVRFTSGDDGCFAHMGYPGDSNTFQLNLSSGCEDKSIALHELGHSLGLFHEQTRADRDKHVDIDWTNIEAGRASQFDKYTKTGEAGADRGAYDYASIMHYGSDAFAKNAGKPVITKKGGGLIPWAGGLSAGDISAVEAMYAGVGTGDDDAPNPDEGEEVLGSCENRCGSDDAIAAGGGETCFCDAGCTEYGDCCSDRETRCGGDGPNPNDDGDTGGAATCQSTCGSALGQQMGNGEECYCDDLCSDNGDCCGDYVATCGGDDEPNPQGDDGGGDDGGGGDVPGSCYDYCGGGGSQGESCYCDDACTATGDCCGDFAAACGGGGGDDGGGDDGGSDDDGGSGGGPSCEGQCGLEADQGGCFCEFSCIEFGDCCNDYVAWCGG